MLNNSSPEINPIPADNDVNFVKIPPQHSNSIPDIVNQGSQEMNFNTNDAQSDTSPLTLHDSVYNDDVSLVQNLNPSSTPVNSVLSSSLIQLSNSMSEMVNNGSLKMNLNLNDSKSDASPFTLRDSVYEEEALLVPVLNGTSIPVNSVLNPGLIQHSNSVSEIINEGSVEMNSNLNDSQSDASPLTLHDSVFNDDFVPVPSTELNPSSSHVLSVPSLPRSTLSESVITTKCMSENDTVTETRPTSNVLIVGTPDSQKSPGNERESVMKVRRSPRLSTPVVSQVIKMNAGSKRGNGGHKKLGLAADASSLVKTVSECEFELQEDVQVKTGIVGNDVSCKTRVLSSKKQRKVKNVCSFVGEPVSEKEAQERWGWRYELKGQRREGQSWILNVGEEDEVHINVECHYLHADVGGCIFSLGDCAHIKGEGKQPHIGKIVEFFKTSDNKSYFRVQWFFRAEDTVMKDVASFHDKKRVFSSNLMNDNLLECILSKVKVIEKAPTLGFQSTSIQPSEYYCDMEYSVKYSTFRSLVSSATDSSVANCDLTMPNNLDANNMAITTTPYKPELSLLDLYAGCGGMSTGLCHGAKLSGVKLVTRWAIDYHKSACDSLKLNHPETEVRHTTAEDFLELLKEWEKLCKKYVLNDHDIIIPETSSEITESPLLDDDVAPEEYEVASLVDICYGDPSMTGEHGLKFKVRWKGYDDPSEDTWELIDGLSDCEGHIRDFVRSGYKSKILPCPGDVDVICGGPPCQGISGYNRFRNTDDPLNDEKNRQIIVFFDIVKFLNPKYVLMENVADILRFDKASLARYALSRLVHMNYQARLGIMAAGAYGLPQFRLRVFLWGAHPHEKLPQFPLPSHEVIVRYFAPAEFEKHTVAYDEGQPRKLEEVVVLRDAISDLPSVTSHEDREEMEYDKPPETEFQKYIRLTKDEFTGSVPKGVTDYRSSVLTDHRPYKLSEDDYHRVCYVPHRKGACFRDFPGVIVDGNNTVHRDPTKQVLLPSGRPLLPDYVFTFEKGKSRRPFARVWWDETVPTVVTFPNCHNQKALHPEQDRVFTLRECARLQGFPDHYRFCGNVKERYCQVGNAVAVTVSKTLGYALGMAFRKLSGDEALMTLPPGFAFQIPPFDESSAEL
ncbi:DNA (cytosine-5)-methyltransferase CMT3-like [Rutidosis leptorrhynchoides]|uniref:DNA (cytosine-5)-methyltransferase CMT3-like n=1 Tax=Rutidosis leptorrhynchoides TaxID=125765 RepID=UPI003A99013E